MRAAAMRWAAFASPLLLPVFPAAAETPEGETIIITAPAAAQDEDDTVRLSARDLMLTGTPDLFGSLARQVPGLSLSEAQGSAYQPDIVHRGFVASPLQGNAQGLAVYLDGGRFNAPFGDTVNLDLVPETAVESVSVKDASAVYGLNALGGAIVLATKTGRSAPGVDLGLSGARFGEVEASAAGGWSRNDWSGYAAAEYRHDAGWRRHSPTTLRRLYADLGRDGADAGLHLKLVGADNRLTGNGPAPVELLAADRRAVFTYPDATHSRFGRISLHPWAALTPRMRMEASLYGQALRQHTVNGDLADIDSCGLTLCLQSDNGGENPLIGTDGGLIPAPAGDGPIGLVNRTATKSNAYGALIQLVDRRRVGSEENVLTIGASYDHGRTRFAADSAVGLIAADRRVVSTGILVDQPDHIIAPVALTAHTSYAGLFLADTLPILPGLGAELGLRYNDARISLRDRLGTTLNGRHGFARLNPGVELDYALSRHASIRAGYSESNRAPTPAELSCAGPDAPCSLTNFFVSDPPLKQVVARSWELGASGQTGTGWKLKWLMSAYRTTNSDDIQLIASNIRGRAYFQNVGRTRRQGVEASVELTGGPLTIGLGYAFTDATFRTPLSLNSPDNPAADADGRIEVHPGNHIPGIPRHRGLARADYQASGFTLGADLQIQSGQHLRGDEANLQREMPGFALLGLHGTVDVGHGLTAFTAVTNLLDRHYATFGTFAQAGRLVLTEAPNATNPRSLSPGSPRRWHLGLRARL